MNKYRFIDENIAATVSTVYYRLKQVDFDGAVNYHGNVQVKFEKETTSTLNMEAYPNPFNGNLNIVLTGLNAGKVDLVMMDIQGKIVKTVTNEVLNSSYLIELNETSNLTDGMYILQAIVNGEVIKLKVVKTSN